MNHGTPPANESAVSARQLLLTRNRELQARVNELDRACAEIAGLLEGASVAILLLDTQLRVLRFSAEAGRRFRLSSRDQGRRLVDLHTGVDEGLDADCRRALQEKRCIERTVQAADGSRLRRHISPFEPAGSNRRGVVIALTEVGDAAATGSGPEQGSDWREAIDDLPVGAVYVKGNDLHMNRAAEALTGYRREELGTLDGWLDALYGPRRNEARALYDARQSAGLHEPVVSKITRRDGSERTVELSGRVRADAEIVVLIDVTEKHALERRIVDIVSEERQEVGRALQEAVLQDMAALGLLAETVRRRSPAGTERRVPERLASGLAQVNWRLGLLAEGLLPLTSEAGDLPAALELLLAHVSAAHDLDCSLICDGRVNIDRETAHHLYHIAHEAVVDVARHARAGCLAIRLEQQADSIELTVVDDGICGAQARIPGLRFQVLSYRCGLIGGRLEIAANGARGAQLVCRLPYTVGREGRPA